MSDIKNYYLNPKIKKIELQEEYSPDQIKEYVKCSQDPIYFIENYVEINSLDKGFVKFILRGYQRDLIKSLHENNKTIILSSRQSGKTVTTAAFILWYALFNPDKTIAILANKAPIAREILARIIAGLERVPFFLQPGTKTLNKGSIEFGNDSRIIASATSSDGIRGMSCNFLYLDEFAFVDNDVEFFKSVFPTISSGDSTKIAISSTPHGLNLFHKLFKDAKDGKNDFTPFEISWDMVPGRDENWKISQLEILGEHGFRQEYGNEFLGSSNTLIAGHILQTLTWEEPIRLDETKTILEDPKENHNYVITVDSSRGVGEDYSVAIVIDVTSYPYKIVCTYRDNNIRPILLSNVIVEMAKKYNGAFLLIERNTVGQTVAESCFYDLEYENIFTTSQGKKGQELRNSFGKSFKLGVEMTSQVKRLGSYMLKTLVEENKLINFTDKIIMEFYTFVNKNNTWMAESGKNDDLVMSLVLFSWAVNQPFFKDITNSDLRLSLMEESQEGEVLSFWVSDGKESENSDNSWLF